MERIKLDIQKFNKSGTVSFNESNNFTARIVWSSTPNTSANTSNITGQLQIRKTSSYSTTGTFTYGFRVGRQTQFSSWYGSLGSGWQTVGTLNDNGYPHNNDGSGSATIEGYATGPDGTSLSGVTVTGSQKVTLDKINRYAVTNSVSGSNVEESFSVNYTKYVSSYKYKLRIGIPNTRTLETIDYNTSGTSFNLSQATIDDLFNTYGPNATFNLGFAVETWNSGGTSKLSSGNTKSISCKTDSKGRIRIGGVWKNATPYVRVGGLWKKTTPYVRINNEWKRGK